MFYRTADLRNNIVLSLHKLSERHQKGFDIFVFLQ